MSDDLLRPYGTPAFLNGIDMTGDILDQNDPELFHQVCCDPNQALCHLTLLSGDAGFAPNGDEPPDAENCKRCAWNDKWFRDCGAPFCVWRQRWRNFVQRIKDRWPA